MDIIFIRNKLPALIAINLIAENLISKNFIFVRHHWKDVNEDSEKSDFFYKMIEEKAFYTIHLVEKKGLIRSYLHVYLLSILAFISCGKFYLAGITYYPYSIAAKLNPLLKIITFDDGMANINKMSKNSYFSNEPYTKAWYYGESEKKAGGSPSILRSLLNFVFPNGPAFFIKKKTILHYTVYNNLENIVHRKKLKYIKIDWESYLSNEDILFLKRFIKSEVSLLIGTDFQEPEHTRRRLRGERKRNFVKNIPKEFMSKLDFIIAHPKDSSNISQLKITRSFHGTAESIIEFLQNQSVVNKINIIHLGTSSAPIIKTFSKVKIYDIFAGAYDKTENNLVHLENL